MSAARAMSAPKPANTSPTVRRGLIRRTGTARVAPDGRPDGGLREAVISHPP
jgi:hypothetical protein